MDTKHVFRCKSSKLWLILSFFPDLPLEISKDLEKELDIQRRGDRKEDKSAEPILEFQFWDFAGQDVYYNAHQVHLLVLGLIYQ